ncbi:glycosyltransferase [Clostridium sp. AWRP]|uniref:glycosyltransferase n=1 Tax=Clostridium sp. AWRP TaxID=2212991 RepID=UPI000FD6D28E|nr:glycosyltransferase [Clostridium sp. AWRP]AZV55409.1 glycosyltransferase [Clostridium sp. AWRP]
MIKEKNFISMVAYMHNEENDIIKFLMTIDGIMKDKFDTYEFVLVNDACKDNTIKKILEIEDKIHGSIEIINMAWKHGMELSMLAGVDLAIGDYIYEFDSLIIDYDVEIVWNMYKKCIEGFDVVSASPKGKSSYSSRLFYKYLNRVSYRKMQLTTETFRLISRRCLNRVLNSKERFRYRKALYNYSGFDTAMIYYRSIDKVTRKNHMNVGERVGFAIDILINFSNIGTRIIGMISLIFFIISLLAGIYTLKSYLTVKSIQPGWTTIMLFLSISFTGMFFILALLSKYMTILLREVKDRPQYVYKSIDKMSKNQ